MNTTRQLILACIKRLGDASVAELSQALDLTQVTIRHHLDNLRDEGFLALAGQRRKPGPGRPEIAYHLTLPAYQSLPRNYESMLLPLLESIHETEASRNLEPLLSAAGSRIGQAYWVEMDAEQDDDLGLCKQDLTQYLEQHGYLPELLQTNSELALFLHNCPFFEARVQHPQVCAFDLALISTWMAPHARIRNVQTDPHKGCRLHLQIRNSN